ncbi:MAG: SCP2 sterol-binding domain-containing protein [Acidimicrobiales bacterium]
MAQFLSPAWIDEVNQAAAENGPSAGAERGAGGAERGAGGAERGGAGPPAPPLVLQQLVGRSDGPDVAYVVQVDGGRVTVAPGRAASPDVTVVEDYSTAAALAQGKLTAQAALLHGRIRLRGDLTALARGQDALERVQAGLDQVRVRTTY